MSFTHWNKRLRLSLALLASGAAFGLSDMAAAQTGYSAPAFREDPGTALSRHLKTLADSPRNMSALMGAAKAALELGDAQAAVTFYARAETIAPRDGRIKAGIGSAFLAMEQPETALRFFEEARSLGAPEGEFAADRGLAYDLTGNSVQAQRDYQLAMRGHDNDELRRRLALSRAITGDRAGALAAIDDQLRRQDRAAWRARAFVLALTGDTAGATETARQMMPQQAAAMQPFFARLPALRPNERAMAVHFGHFPGDGSIAPTTTYAAATPILPPAVTDAGRPNGAQLASRAPVTTPPPVLQNQGPRRAISGPVQTRPQTAVPAPNRPATRPPAPSRERDSGSLAQRWADARGLTLDRPAPRTQVARNETQPSMGAPLRPVQGPPAISQPLRLPSAAPAPTQFAAAQPPVTRPPAPASVVNTAASAPAGAAPTLPPVSMTLRSSAPPPPRAAAAAIAPGIETAAPAVTPTIAPASVAGTTSASTNAPATSGTTPAQLTASPLSSEPVQGPPAPAGSTPPVQAGTTPAPVQAVATSPAPAAQRSTLPAGLASVAATIRSLDLNEAEAKPQAEGKRAEPAKPEAKPATAEAAAQHWVQIAGSADKSTLKGEFARLKAKAPKLLGDKTAWTTPLKFTNRLLVGPFKSEGEAQSLVNELAKAELAAFTWTSPSGQAVEKLATK